MDLWKHCIVSEHALESELNTLSLNEWEVFTVLPAGASGQVSIVARRASYRQEVEAAVNAAPNWVLEARDLLSQGRKIEAIKHVREATGWGLKEAKDYVEQKM